MLSKVKSDYVRGTSESDPQFLCDFTVRFRTIFWFGTFLQLKILKCQYNIDNLESERCDSKGKTKKRFLLYFSVQPFESPSFWLQDRRFKVFQLRECPKLAKIVRRNALSHVHMMKFNEWSSKTVTLNISLSESDLNFVCHDFTFWNIMAQKIYFENSKDFIKTFLGIFKINFLCHDFPKCEIITHTKMLGWWTQTDVQDLYFRSSFTMWKKII